MKHIPSIIATIALLAPVTSSAKFLQDVTLPLSEPFMQTQPQYEYYLENNVKYYRPVSTIDWEQFIDQDEEDLVFTVEDSLHDLEIFNFEYTTVPTSTLSWPSWIGMPDDLEAE